MDRSIPIYLKRQAPGERVARFRRRDVKPEADELRERVFEWASGIIGELREARLALPENLSDRRQDGLEPLLAIAEAAGGEWPQRIRTAALEVFASTAAEDASIGVQLLADIRTIFDDRADDKITSEDMIAKLRDIESSPWADWDHGEGLGKNKLARFLRKYDVAPRTVRLEAQVAKGYLREPFADAWSRYVTPGLYAGSRKSWRRGAESNRRIKVLQTSPLPLGYRALPFHLSSLPYQHLAQGSVLSGSWSNSAPRRLPPR